MNQGTKVYVRIGGKGYNLISNEAEEHMREVSAEVDRKMTELLRQDSRITHDTAAVLTAVNMCSELKKERLVNEMNVEKSETAEGLEKKLAASLETIAELKKQLEKEREEFKEAEEKLRLEWVLKEQEFLDMIDNG